MKNVVAYFFFLLEIIGIIAVSVIIASRDSVHFATVIKIPEGMQLTLEKEIEVDTRDGVNVVPEGTVIIPEEISPYKDVIFSYDGYEWLRTNWDNFKEKDQFESLLVKAEHDREDAILKNHIRLIGIGVAIAAGWLLIGGFLTRLSIKHEKGIFAVIFLHVAVIAIIALFLFTLNTYLCK